MAMACESMVANINELLVEVCCWMPPEIATDNAWLSCTLWFCFFHILSIKYLCFVFGNKLSLFYATILLYVCNSLLEKHKTLTALYILF